MLGLHRLVPPEHDQEATTACCVVRPQACLMQHHRTVRLRWIGCYIGLYLARLVVVAGLHRPVAPCMPVSLANLRFTMIHDT